MLERKTPGSLSEPFILSTDIRGSFMESLRQQKEEAWARFRASGYRDHGAREEFVRLYKKMQKWSQ